MEPAALRVRVEKCQKTPTKPFAMLDQRQLNANQSPLNQLPSNQPPLYLIYSGAVDLRLCLILAKLGLSVRPVSNIDAFLAMQSSRCDGIVLVDVSTQADGAVLVAQLISRLQRPLVIPICADGSVEFCRKCFKAGAVDVLDKSCDEQAVGEALRAGLEALGCRTQRPARGSLRRERFALLTQREREVFNYVAEGLNNYEIGEVLDISPRTVEYYRAHLKEKLAARNLAQMVRRYGPFLDETFETPCINDIPDI